MKEVERVGLKKALRVKRKNFQKTFFYLTDVLEEAVAPLQCWSGEVMYGALQ